MISVTLSTLSAEFEAACTALLGTPLNFNTVRRLLRDNTASVHAGATFFGHSCGSPEFCRMLLAYNVEQVAFSFHDEREGLEAAMLYKLSDSAIDPRKP